MEKPRLINCHTHIFTGDHVPPWLAKTFLPWPLYYLLPISLVVGLVRFWYNGPYRIKFHPLYKKSARWLNSARAFMSSNLFFRFINYILGIFIVVHVFFIFFDWLSRLIAPEASGWLSKVKEAQAWLMENNLLFIDISTAGRLGLIIIMLLFFSSGRNLILFVFRKLWSFFALLPGKQTTDLFRRYLNIGKFARYKHQHDCFERLRNQYPEGTGFVILPMDMEYMSAGRVRSRYQQQMDDLVRLKRNYPDTFFPFVFVDPRRIKKQPAFFNYTVKDGKMVMGDCLLKNYIEQENFNGFKIYPALGYYPFEEELLPVWKYAADNKLPVLTHCIRGTIFYRGRKQGSWNRHPVFEEALGVKGKSLYKPLLLPQMMNVDFSVNFTHPLNYLCLLDESLLRKLVAKAGPQVKDLFGYTDANTRMKHDLQHLKLCFGHFGGDDEWLRFFEKDRDPLGNQLSRVPGWGIEFFYGDDGRPLPGKLEQVWKNADWYSIICSLMQQYPNVYADISYILHDDATIKPLLKQTLQKENDQLRKRVLFGTDFYVVRNHKSDKNMLSDMWSDLTEEEFDLIARHNPQAFLSQR